MTSTGDTPLENIIFYTGKILAILGMTCAAISLLRGIAIKWHIFVSP